MAMLPVRIERACCVKGRGFEHTLHFFSLIGMQMQNTAELSAEHSAGLANLLFVLTV